MLTNKKPSIKKLQMIEYVQEFTPFTPLTMVALFNSSRINEERVRELIIAGECSPFVVTISKNVYENLFDLEENSDDELYNDLRLEQQEQM